VSIAIDETLPIIKKSKHPKDGEYKGKNGRTYAQEDKKKHQRGQTIREHQVPETSLVTRSI